MIEKYLIEPANYSECTKHLLPLMDTIEVLNGKWKMPIIMALWTKGTSRFNELQRTIPRMTNKILSHELKQLEEHGIVTRTVKNTMPMTVEYKLTEYGKTLDKVMVALRDWGVEHRQKIMVKK